MNQTDALAAKQSNFDDEPALSDDSSCPQNAAPASEARYFSLFEHASEAMVSFRPQQGAILDANVQASKLLGHARAAMQRMNFRDLFAAPHHEQVDWLIEQIGGSANLRLEDVTLKRADGLAVPVSLSCNWLKIDGAFIAQVIMHDMTQQREIQRELRSYAEQLEARVAQRAGELKLSEDRYRTLFFQEQQRGRHLSLINDVQGCALETRDIEHFLHRVTAAIQAHFRDCDVTFYLRQTAQRGAYSDLAPQFNAMPRYSVAARAVQLDFTLSETAASLAAATEGAAESAASTRAPESLVVVAQTGGHGLSPEVGTQVAPDTLPGLVTDGSNDTLIVNDVPSDARYQRLSGTHRDPGAQICVAVRVKDDFIGVVSVQSDRAHHFDPRDGVALQTAATIAAAHVQAIRMFLASNELKEFNQTLISTMLHSLMVVDDHGLIQFVNERLCQTLYVERDQCINASFARVLGEDVIEQHGLREALRDVTQHGATREIPEVRFWARDVELYFDLRISRVYFRGQAQAVILMINLTQRFRRTRQLQLINEMGSFLQSSLDIDRVLRITLTCITAGPALGFNRAFLLLFDDDEQTLRGAMAVGPSSAEEAARIWREMGRREQNLTEILSDEGAFAASITPLQELVSQLAFEVSDPRFAAIARAIRERQPLRVARDQLIAPAVENSEYSQAPNASTAARSAALLQEIMVASETAIAPLASKDRVVGVVLIDNLYSQTPVEENELRLLGTLAQQAGLTLDNALTYQALQKAQRDLVAAERLVVVGEMAARVSHEIRNPLATIGGFARSIAKHPDSVDGVERKSGIIVEEVERLEELLGDLLDMARSSQLEYSPQDINALVEHALLLADADIKASGAEVQQHLDASLPILMADRRRLLQALLNTMRNAAQAMPDGGTLAISTRSFAQNVETVGIEIEIKDTGQGISEKARQQVFDPFFSTKIRGSGLGLAVTLRIVRDHGGDIDVFSEEGVGTSFVMSLTLPRATPVSTPPDPGRTARPDSEAALAFLDSAGGK